SVVVMGEDGIPLNPEELKLRLDATSVLLEEARQEIKERREEQEYAISLEMRLKIVEDEATRLHSELDEQKAKLMTEERNKMQLQEKAIALERHLQACEEERVRDRQRSEAELAKMRAVVEEREKELVAVRMRGE